MNSMDVDTPSNHTPFCELWGSMLFKVHAPPYDPRMYDIVVTGMRNLEMIPCAECGSDQTVQSFAQTMKQAQSHLDQQIQNVTTGRHTRTR